MRKIVSDSGPALWDVEVLVPSLNSGWSVQSSFDPPRLYKDPGGMVTIVAALASTGATASAFSIPPGWRPAVNVQAPASYWNGTNRVLGTAYCSSVLTLYSSIGDTIVAATYWAVNMTYKQAT